jgi:hypothetical protein
MAEERKTLSDDDILTTGLGARSRNVMDSDGDDSDSDGTDADTDDTDADADTEDPS